mmetsp:Transcript_38307/g.105691  ORF Transcript_38307/g.105691 Transcript_38307/m.105691 type:complete len:211 (-) Transcript_38307:1255-1887(-)
MRAVLRVRRRLPVAGHSSVHDGIHGRLAQPAAAQHNGRPAADVHLLRRELRAARQAGAPRRCARRRELCACRGLLHAAAAAVSCRCQALDAASVLCRAGARARVQPVGLDAVRHAGGAAARDGHAAAHAGPRRLSRREGQMRDVQVCAAECAADCAGRRLLVRPGGVPGAAAVGRGVRDDAQVAHVRQILPLDAGLDAVDAPHQERGPLA